MKKTLTVLFVLFVITTPLFSAAPPDRMNFQGVLRNASNAPQNGTFDMVFQFYDAATLGNQILLDTHTGGSAVTVTGGMFNVQLGSGVVTDGTGTGTYTTLTNMFRDFSSVFVEVHVSSDTLTPRIQVASAGHALNAEHADLLDGLDSTAFATASHVHQTLTAGAGLGGVSYDGGTAKTFSVNYGTAANTAVQGNQTATITAGNGITGTITSDALGDGFSATLNVGAGSGISVATDTVLLGPLTSNWNQTGAFDISLSNAGSELSMLESTGATFFGTLDVGDLAANQTYTFSGTGGTVWTTGNDGAGSSLDADTIDGINSTSFLRSDVPTTFSGGVLNLSTGTSIITDSASANLSFGGSNLLLNLGDDSSDFVSVRGQFRIQAPSTAFFGYLGVSNTNTADQNYTLAGPGGTIWTTGNDGAGSLLDADLLDGISSGSFLRSNATDSYTVGTLTLDPATTFAVNGTFKVGSDSSTDDDSIFFDDGASEFLKWEDSLGQFELSDSLLVSQVTLNSTGHQLQFKNGSSDMIGYFDITGYTSALTLTLEGSDKPGDPTNDFNLAFVSMGSQSVFISDLDADQTGGGFEWKNNGSLSTDRIMDLSTSGNLEIGGALSQNVGFDLAENYFADSELSAGELVSITAGGPRHVALSRAEGDTTVLGVVSAKPGVVLGGGAFSEAALREAWGQGVADVYLSQKDRMKSLALTKPNGLLERRKQIDSANPAMSTRKSDVSKEGMKQFEQARAQYESDLEGEALAVFFEENMVPIALSGRTPVKVDTQYGEIKIGDELGPSPIPGVAMKLTSAGPTIGTAMENFSGGRGMVMTFVHRGWYSPAAGNEQTTGTVKVEAKTPTPNPDMLKHSEPGDILMNADIRTTDDSSLLIQKDSKESGEVFRVNEPMEEGDVLAADRSLPGVMRKANTAYDPAVVGIVAARTGGVTESMMDEMWKEGSRLVLQFESARSSGDRVDAGHTLKQIQTQFDLTHAMIAPSGRVTVCKVDAAYGGIEVGNLLVASPTAGHAMRSDNPLPGTVIGKALEPLAAGTGLIRVLVMLR